MSEIYSYTVPHSGSNTTYYFEDTDLRSRVADAEAYIGYTDSDVAGLEVDYENNTFTRLAGAVGKSGGSDFNVFPTYAGMRRCILADDGTVVAYYGDSGYIEDGSAGQCMVEIPKFYYKVVPMKLQKQSWDDYDATPWVSGTSYSTRTIVIYENEYYVCTTANSDTTFTPSNWLQIQALGLMGYHILKARYYISATPKEGFKIHPLFVDKTTGNIRNYAYISSYSGILYDVSESKYLLNDEQISNITPGTGDKLSSINGMWEREITYHNVNTDQDVTVTVNTGAKPCTDVEGFNNLTRHNCTILAENRGSGWEQQTIEITCAIWLLFIIEYGNCNIQNSIGKGIVEIEDNFVGNCSSFIGSTSSLGNNTGNATSTMDYTGTVRTDDGCLSCSYRGVEDFYGNVFKWVEGINIYGAYVNGGGQTFVCTDTNYTDNKTTDNYENVGFTLTPYIGYIKYFGYGNPKYDWLFMPSKANGNSSLPVGDLAYVTQNVNNNKVFAFGGTWSDSISRAYTGYYCHCGFNYSSWGRPASARLTYLPTA